VHQKIFATPLKFAGAAPKTNSAEGQKVLSPPKTVANQCENGRWLDWAAAARLAISEGTVAAT
jgi:hypothetical protein